MQQVKMKHKAGCNEYMNISVYDIYRYANIFYIRQHICLYTRFHEIIHGDIYIIIFYFESFNACSLYSENTHSLFI